MWLTGIGILRLWLVLGIGMAAVADIVLEAAEPNIDIETVTVVDIETVAVVDIEPVVELDTDTVVAVADIGPVVAPCSDTAIAADIEPVVAPGALVDRKVVVNCP